MAYKSFFNYAATGSSLVIFTVPAGQVFYLCRYTATAVCTGASLQLSLVESISGAFIDIAYAAQNVYGLLRGEIDTPIPFPPGSNIEILCNNSSTNLSGILGGYSL